MVISPKASANSHWVTGGLIGAGVGVGAGIGIGYGVCGLAEENKNECRAYSMSFGSMLTGAAGFGIGALIGSAIKKGDPTTKRSFFTPNIAIDPMNGTYGISGNIEF